MDEAFISRFWNGVDKNGPVPAHCPELGPCWLWTRGRKQFGYGLVHVRSVGLRKSPWLAHRLSWVLTRGQLPPFSDHKTSTCVLHRCDSPPCCNPAHLFLGTVKENNADMVAKGRNRSVRVIYAPAPRMRLNLIVGAPREVAAPGPLGEDHPQARLSTAQVHEIRSVYRKGSSHLGFKGLSKRFGVAPSVIEKVVKRVTWRHV